MFEDQGAQLVLKIQHYQFQESQENQSRSKEDLIKQYAQKRNSIFDENKKLLDEERKLSQEKVYLITVKGLKQSTLNLAITEYDKSSKIKIKMDQINVPTKVHFHRKTSEVLYADILKPFLENKKMESKISKLEEQLKNQKAMSKGWQVQIKKLETYLMVVGKKSDSKNPAKKLLDEKDKTISSLKKKIEILVTYHPQT